MERKEGGWKEDIDFLPMHAIVRAQHPEGSIRPNYCKKKRCDVVASKKRGFGRGGGGVCNLGWIMQAPPRVLLKVLGMGGRKEVLQRE